MEAIRSSETSVLIRATRRHLPEDDKHHRKKGIPHIYVNLLPLLSVEAKGVCILIGNAELLLAAVFKSLQRVWNDTLLFGSKTILAGDLNAKHLIWNSKVSNPSCLKLLGVFVRYSFKISSTQCPMHCTPDGRGYVLNSVVHQNVQWSEIIVTEVLDSDHLPVMVSIVDHVRARDVLDPTEKCWDHF
jgi:hypothetical protein